MAFIHFLTATIFTSSVLLPVAEAASARPPALPTLVYFQLSLNGLRKIDAVDSSFVTDFYASYAWRDDRLFTEIDGDFNSETMFAPAPEFINAEDFEITGGLDYTIVAASDIPSWASVSASGDANETWVVATGRKVGPFIAELQLEEFPFDKQSSVITMESSVWRSSELIWVPRGVVEGLSTPGVQTDGWNAIGVQVVTSNYTYKSLQESYSRVTMSKTLQREYSYYVSRVCSNIILLVIMAAFVAFVNAKEADRLGFVQASFLGVVSWLFVLNAEVPKVGYLTRLDAFINVSFACIFAQYVYHAVHWGLYKTIDRCMGREVECESDSEDEGAPEPQHHYHKKGHHHHPAAAHGAATQGADIAAAVASGTNVVVIAPSRLSRAGSRDEGSGLPSAAVDPLSPGGVTVNAMALPAPSPNASPVATSSDVAMATTLGSAPQAALYASAAAPQAATASKRGKKPHAVFKRRACGTWPFSWYGEWHLFNPHRKLDVVVTSVIMVVYACAVAAIIGQGIKVSNSADA